ncbi:hypothetical protein FOA43_001771 [Brettanomyces nanus]|uniref:3beta-hydroxysteroid 3-dehydrogenase n=1 Tax=Eeniella nana TaxID=13502 RepID=A0A875S305_EENNA|nr:uncharacterized protein FOA43_001771 [Brettanomyces nanus]QPG74442.1 hypothetical protein FOA43_001771 [Brettanomyces nanus]
MSAPRKIAIITGTSGNLGINIAYRLCDEIPSDHRLTIIVTSRTLVKANETIKSIEKYNDEHSHRKTGFLDFDYLLLDFGDMISVATAIYKLKKDYPKLDYLFLNASQNAHDHFDYFAATKQMLSDPIGASTCPEYKMEKVGVKTKDGMGFVFQVNVFGPFYFIESLKKCLFVKSEDPRIIWVGSVMSKTKYLSFDDMQLLRTEVPYGGSKRLVDLVHLATYKELYDEYGIKQYLTHPGVFVSFSFFKFLNIFSYYIMMMMFYMARFLGSPWHNLTGWNAANAPIFVALKADIKSDRQDLKYGSASTARGHEYLKIDEIDPTGKDDVLKYLKQLKEEWDEKLKDQVTDTRRAY